MEVNISNGQNALFFIPDISGFTRFMSDRDLQHGKHIIAELLEILIDSNQLDLKVNEVEGDAIFFYRLGNQPSTQELVEQAEKMYIAFHHHLKKYGVSRLCNCASCRNVSGLTLKFFVHYGDASFHRVKNYEKLFGTDVILIHRLMKNDIIEHEYLLLTEKVGSDKTDVPEAYTLDWYNGEASYDLGNVKYFFSSLSNWYQRVPDPLIPELKVYRSKKPMFHSIEIEAPVDLVYDSLIDLNQRKNYFVGLKSIQIRKEEVNRLNRICTTFQCSMEHEKCTFETSDVRFTDDERTFSETFKEHPMTFDYVVKKSDGRTSVSFVIHPALKFPMSILFNLFMKRKLVSETKQTLENLKAYCEEKAVKVGE